jgi:hypothetical protein
MDRSTNPCSQRPSNASLREGFHIIVEIPIGIGIVIMMLITIEHRITITTVIRRRQIHLQPPSQRPLGEHCPEVMRLRLRRSSSTRSKPNA